MTRNKKKNYTEIAVLVVGFVIGWIIATQVNWTFLQNYLSQFSLGIKTWSILWRIAWGVAVAIIAGLIYSATKKKKRR